MQSLGVRCSLQRVAGAKPVSTGGSSEAVGCRHPVTVLRVLLSVEFLSSLPDYFK